MLTLMTFFLETARPRENDVTSCLANVYGERLARSWWKYAKIIFLSRCLQENRTFRIERNCYYTRALAWVSDPEVRSIVFAHLTELYPPVVFSSPPEIQVLFI